MTASAIYKRLLAYATPYWRVFVITALAMILFAATDTGFAALMKPMLDGNFIEHDPDTVKLVPLALIALFMFRGLAGFLSRYGMSWIGRRVIQVLRRELFHQLLRLPAQYFDRNPSGRLLSRLTFDVEQVAEATANAVTILIRDSMTLIFLLAYMFWISGWLTMLFLIIGPVLVGLIRAVSRRFRSISRRIQDSMGELTQFSEEAIHGQRLIKSFTGERWQETLFEQVNERNRKLHLKMAAALGASTPIVQFIAACILALVIYLATLESVTREISVGSFVSFIAAMLLLMQPIKRLTNVNASVQRGVAAARSLFEVLDEAVEQDRGTAAALRVPVAPSSSANSVLPMTRPKAMYSAISPFPSCPARRSHWWGARAAVKPRSPACWYAFTIRSKAQFTWTVRISVITAWRICADRLQWWGRMSRCSTTVLRIISPTAGWGR